MGFIVFNDGTNTGGGGGSTVDTGNGISGTGAALTPVILGGDLTEDTTINPAGFTFEIGPLTISAGSLSSSVGASTADELVRFGQLQNWILNSGSFVSGQVGTFATRPAFGTIGRIYVAQDTQQIFWDTGAAWQLVANVSSAVITGADNGLTVTAGEVQLGGQLIQNTVIDINGFTFQIGTGASPDDFHYDGSIANLGIAISGGTAAFQANTTRILFGWNNSSGVSQININAAQGMTVRDDINLTGLQIQSSAYYANFGPLTYITQGYADARYVQTAGVASIVASDRVTGVSANSTLITFAVPGSSDLSYRVNAAFLFRSGTGTATVNIAYTDETGAAQSFSYTPIASGPANVSPIIINAKNATNIVISAVITGTAIADFYTFLEYLP